MNTAINRSRGIWLNPSMLRWAREWRGRTMEEAAQRVGKTPHHIDEWEQGLSAPTVRQARTLARYYDRSFLELFLPDPPEIAAPVAIPDFRMQRGATPPSNEWELQDILRWAETQRINALDLYGELGEEPATLPDQLFASLADDPEEVALNARIAIGFPVQDQIRMTKKDAESLPVMLRRYIESIGVMTLRTPELKKLKVRGIAIARFPLPVIVFSNEAPTAQAFSIAHEFAHILVNASGISGHRAQNYNQLPVERWSDRFAASFLMPVDQIVAIVGDSPSLPLAGIDDNELKRLADIFRVSPHAMLIRLVHLRYIDADFYWNVKHTQFVREEEDYSSFARSSYYGSRYRSSHGDLYTRLVLEAWGSGRITNHNAAEYMGVSNLAHLNDIRDHFDAS